MKEPEVERQKLLAAAVEVGVPAHLVDGLVEYAVSRRRTGDFLQAVLANDLFAAIQYGDPLSLSQLPLVVRYIYLFLPARSWGSRGAVTKWLEGD